VSVRFRAPFGDITNVPQARLYGGNGTGASTRFLDKSDFIRLRNLTLGYSLNNKMIEDMGMSSVRLYLTGVNLLFLLNIMTQKPEDDAGVGEEFYSAPAKQSL
jgi:hypothetical protein